jgi:hypothetical protein
MKFVFNCNDRKGFRKEVDEIGVIFNTEAMEKRHRAHRVIVTKHFYLAIRLRDY